VARGGERLSLQRGGGADHGGQLGHVRGQLLELGEGQVAVAEVAHRAAGLPPALLAAG
jgi:hypothetical protein